MFDEQPDGGPHGECAAEIHRLQAQNDEMLAALQCAATVLFLLKDEVAALGFNAKNVPEMVRAAIAAATGQKGE